MTTQACGECDRLRHSLKMTEDAALDVLRKNQELLYAKQRAEELLQQRELRFNQQLELEGKLRAKVEELAKALEAAVPLDNPLLSVSGLLHLLMDVEKEIVGYQGHTDYEHAILTNAQVAQIRKAVGK